MNIKYRRDLHKAINLSLPAAEIGVAKGDFSLEMLQWGVKKLYCVDPWREIPDGKGMATWPQSFHDDNLRLTKDLLKGYDNVEYLIGTSEEMADSVPNNSLGFVYIDACHEYECVLQDLELWTPKLVFGGIMAGHDFLNTDYKVREAVMKFTHGKYTVRTIPDISRECSSFYFINK